MSRMMNLRNCIALLLCVVTSVSCNREMFDEDDYKKIVEQAQPVTNIDASQTWELTTDYYITVETAGVLPGAKRLRVLDGNPAAGQGATVLGDYLLDGEDKQFVAFSAPTALTKFYAALVDDDNNYTITAFTPAERAITFDEPVASRVKVDSRQVGLQAYSYCFEDEMPQPGDYDYNDVVVRISMERTAMNQITLNVSLAAVGSLSQVAAAMRLINYKYTDIESVTTVDGENFDKGYKKSALPYIDSESLLMEGLNGEAVINLFEDAHWATGAVSYTSEGYVPRYKYNVSKTTSSEHDMMSPRTVSFVVTFKNPVLLNYFTMSMLDLFTITEYNGALMENHAQYKYKLETVLHDYVQPTSALILPWALTVPTSAFRYPLDGVNIGYAKDGAYFGAYMTSGHAFGQWSANRNTAKDWYNYPNSNMVY